MTEHSRCARWARRPAALVRAAAARPVLGGTSYALDVAVAAAATIAAVVAAVGGYLPTVTTVAAPHHPGGPRGTAELKHTLFGGVRVFAAGPGSHLPPIGTAVHLSAAPSLAMAGVILTTAPLAFRRTYPASAFCVIVLAIIATSRYTTAVTIAAAVFAAYFAVVYSRNRPAALGCLAAGAAVVTLDYPKIGPEMPSRLAPLVVLLLTVAFGYMMRNWQQRAGESATRLRRAEAEHLEATRRAVEEERARIAAELHDVVTHNVSVMVVQAGAGRRILDRSPAEAREAMLAIEASGRTAMTELRHLLGLLAPSAAPRVTGTERQLAPGPDLAAYRVVQEALTNVIRHAEGARATVRIEHRARDLVIDVANVAGRPGSPAGGTGRGLIGLRERIAIYGGSLEVGPRPGGGWRVRATIPLEPTVERAPLSFSGARA